jgi:hypothetical protein
MRVVGKSASHGQDDISQPPPDRMKDQPVVVGRMCVVATTSALAHPAKP